MAVARPISTQQIFKVPDGRPITLNSRTLQSDSCICFQRNDNEKGLIAISMVDIRSGNRSLHQVPAANATHIAIIHRSQRFVAYQTRSHQVTLHIFDLSTNQDVFTTGFSEEIIFWDWVSESTIGIVTRSSVFVWEVFRRDTPELSRLAPSQLCALADAMKGRDIVNIRSSADGKCYAVAGSPRSPNDVVGFVQLCVRTGAQIKTMSFEGNAVAFYSLGGTPGSPIPRTINLLIFGGVMHENPKEPHSALKPLLRIAEVVDEHPKTFATKTIEFPNPDQARGDFPIGVQVSQKYGVIYLVTKMGYLHLYELESASSVLSARISAQEILATSSNADSTGVIYNIAQEVLSVAIDESAILPYLLQQASNTAVAMKLAKRADLPGADHLFLGSFEQLWQSEKYTEAARLASNFPQRLLRSPGMVNLLGFCYIMAGQPEQVQQYIAQTGSSPDWIQTLQHIIRLDSGKGVRFATALVKQDGGSWVNLDRVVDIVQSQAPPSEACHFLASALEENKPEHGHLQTRLLELSLMNDPPFADALLGTSTLTHFDKGRIASLCEQAGLHQRALELYEDPESVKRVVINIAGAPGFKSEWLVAFFGRLSVEQSLDCLDAMMKHNIRQNLQSVVQIATKYSDLLSAPRLIDLFEKYKTAEGLFYYLGSIVNLSEDTDVHFKYIEAATKMGQFNEVERVCRDSNYYNPEKVKNFLKEAKLTEQLPLIIVCDRFNFVHDLVLYLYQNQQFKSIEVYVQRVNPARTPAVIGGLLDVDCEESIIKNLLSTIDPSQIPIDELVTEVETRNRLKLLLPFLEATLAAGNQQQAVYNALAKIYIDSNNNPEKFLKENDQYDSLLIGKYCEKRDPNLAYIAYRKGNNDLELVNITNENSMYKAQARYLLERADRELWNFVLSENNIHRRSVVDQVISTAVPESTDPAKVSEAIACFLAADLPGELIELLEKIVLEPSPFSDNPNLQNLLMFTAAKADKARVMDYIHKLDGFNPQDITTVCIEVGLYEEAFEIFKKIGDKTGAVNVLVEHVVSIDRAQAYAEDVDLPEVWSKVAKAQLDGLRITDSIESYLKAEDPKNYAEVIEVATHAGKNEDLIKYLRMARKTLREPAIDTALAFCYARLDQLSDLEDFLRGTNVANIEESGDKAYAEGLFEASKIFYTSISNWAKLATTLVHLGDYQAAVECARKANSIKVWKEVHGACVDKKEFRLAQICGLNLIVDAEQLQALVKQYERNGFFDELISLLENGLGLERAHMGMFTELGIALSKYHPERLIEHLNLFWSRMNLPKMIRACEEANLWPELVFCYVHYDEFDNAALTVMERPENSWEHQQFREIVVKVANLEIYYKAINFYLEQHPSLITDLLQVLTARIDVNRVVKMFQKSDNLPLIKPFLLNVQSQNKRTVNNAINDLLIEEEDYKTLRDSVENYDNYEPVELAQRLEKHDLVFFRQIAASIYRKNKRWEKSIALSKQDKLWKDAIETAALSGKPDVVEELLRYFVDIGNRECYVGMLYACNDLIRPDLVLEVSWRHGLHDFTMPYMINLLCSQTKELAALKADNEARKAREKEQEKNEDNTPILGGNRLMITAGPSGGAAPGGRMSPAPFAGPNGFVPQPTGYGY